MYELSFVFSNNKNVVKTEKFTSICKVLKELVKNVLS